MASFIVSLEETVQKVGYKCILRRLPENTGKESILLLNIILRPKGYLKDFVEDVGT